MHIKKELKPWLTPNFVSEKEPVGKREDGVTWAAKYSIQDVPAETLSELCDQFRKEVFEKAGKRDPKQQEQ